MVKQKTAWDKLSMNERAQFIKLGLQHGLGGLKDIKDTYNFYADGGRLVHKKSGEKYEESSILQTSVPSYLEAQKQPYTEPKPVDSFLGSDYVYNFIQKHKDSMFPGGDWRLNSPVHRIDQAYMRQANKDSQIVGVDYLDLVNKQTDKNVRSGEYLQSFFTVTPKYFPNKTSYHYLYNTPEMSGHYYKSYLPSMGWHEYAYSTGGPLYPFSFAKNPFLKTPVVRYDEGGHLHGFGDWLNNLFSPSDTTPTTVNAEPAPLDLGELATRQAYAESRFDSNAVSPANAIGLFQVTPTTLSYYNQKTGNAFTSQDLYDDTVNQQIRDWYMNDLMNRPWNTKNNPSDSVQYAKSLGAYNWGPTNLVDTLNKAKADGVDIYNSWDWLSYLPAETRDYINFVLRNQNNSAHRNNMMYNRTADKYQSKISAIKSNE